MGGGGAHGPIPPVTFPRLTKSYLRNYLAYKNGSPIKTQVISYAIGIYAYFPTLIKCRPHMHIFLMGAYYWV